MKSVLFVTYRLSLGYGVDIVVNNIASQLRQRGIIVKVGALEIGPGFQSEDHVLITADPEAVRKLAASMPQPCLVVAHTSPFFEVLPALANEYEVWAYEYGDPTPELFDADAGERRRIADHKKVHVYPHVDKVITISDFLRHDIDWHDSELIYCGVNCDPNTPEPERYVSRTGQPIRVGGLMRLGTGEARYKGNSLFLDLVRQVRQQKDLDVEFHVAGRTTDNGAAEFQSEGIQPHVNLSDEEKEEYLRSLDIFISFSLWEGFNLPLAEAQSLGTMSLAFDTGAHPEVCPFIMSNLQEMIPFIRRASEDRAWLATQSQRCHAFVKDRFTWEKAADRFCKLANLPA